MRTKVYNNGVTAIPYCHAVKVAGSYTDPSTGMVYLSVVAATAADAGIASADLMVATGSIQPFTFGEATDDEELSLDTSSLGAVGSDVFLANSGAFASVPGATAIRVGEVTVSGIIGNVLVSTATARTTAQTATGSGPGAVAGPETVTSGALNPSVRTSFVSVTATKAYTLADGQTLGQRKTLRCTVAASSPAGTITPATPQGFTTIVFGAVGSLNAFVELEWNQPGNGTTLGWYVVAQAGTVTIS